MLRPQKLIPIVFTLFLCSVLVYAQQQGPPPKYFDERFVIKAMADISRAEAAYMAASGSGIYGSLAELHAAGFIDAALGSGRKYGYAFTITPAADTYVARATPVAYKKTGLRSYYLDQRGVLFGADLGGSPANDQNAHYIDTCALWGINVNERCTIAAIRTLLAAQATYAATVGNGDYAKGFQELHGAGLIDMVLATASKHGYNFVMETTAGPTGPSLKIWAVPSTYGATGIRSFFVDETGVVRGADRQGGNAGPADPPVKD